MKTKDYASFIKDYSDLLKSVNADKSRQAWEGLIPLFTINDTMTVAQLTKQITKFEFERSYWEQGQKVEAIVNQIPSFIRLLESRAKKAYVTDTLALGKALENHSSASIHGLVKNYLDSMAVEEQKKIQAKIKKQEEERKQHELVKLYITKLEDALGDDEVFPKCIAEIKGKELGLPAATIKKIATEFSGKPSSKVKNKTEAIKAIQQRHEALMTGRAKSQATGDRTAA